MVEIIFELLGFRTNIYQVLILWLTIPLYNKLQVMKTILIINAFPSSEFLGWAMAEQYAAGAIASGNSVELLHLNQLNFNPILKKGIKR